MSDLIYNLTRQQAAEILGISTRTLDRRIRKGLLSYKKVGNKILLAEQEVLALKNQSDTENINKVYHAHIVSEKNNSLQVHTEGKDYAIITKELNDIFLNFSKEIEKFFELLKEKDNIIEEKNRIIFSLQHKIGEYEMRLKNMIALPDYSREKEKLLLEKEKLEFENEQLKKMLYKERIYKILALLIVLFLIILVVFLNVKLF